MMATSPRADAAARAPRDAASAFCQCCDVALHRLRRGSTCSFCQERVCQYCSWRSDAKVVCKGCQPQVKGDQPAFSFRQFLWRLKMLPFGCRGEKWLFLARKRQLQVSPTEMTAEDFHYLTRLHYAHRVAAGPGFAQQQRMIDSDIERTFQQLQAALTSPKRSSIRAKPVFSMPDFLVWKSTTHQLLSVFLFLKPQIGYCQGMTYLAATLTQESKLNNETAFRLFLWLTEKYKMDHVFGPDMKDINLRFFQLDEVLRLHLPQLHAHLSDRDVHPATYASSWILTLFTDCKLLPHRMVLRFLDIFFEVGWKAFYQLCLAVFNTLEPALMRRTSADGIFAYLSSVRYFHTHKSDLEINHFFARARLFKITSTFLDHLQGEFSTEASMSMSEYD